MPLGNVDEFCVVGDVTNAPSRELAAGWRHWRRRSASSRARDFFNLDAVIMKDGPGAHVRVSFVNSGVDRGAASVVARPASLRAGDHAFADTVSDFSHCDKRATVVENANLV